MPKFAQKKYFEPGILYFSIEKLTYFSCIESVSQANFFAKPCRKGNHGDSILNH
jgi:hypothetical protein